MEISKISKEFKKKNGHWNVDLEFIITFYHEYLMERNWAKVCAALEMKPTQLLRLIEKYPELQQAKALAESNRHRPIMSNYIMRNLSPQARQTWTKLTTVDSQEEIDALFKGRPERLRQELFCHAILHTGYDYSKACQMVGIDYRKMQSWKSDLDFCQMLEEIKWHKKNFFEKGVLNLVAEGHPGAIIFVNRTVNRDRGYAEEVPDAEIKDQLDYGLDELELDLPTMKKVLEAIEKKKKRDAEEEAFAGAKQLPSPTKKAKVYPQG